MSFIVGMICGALVGVPAGVILTALAAISARSDEEMEQITYEHFYHGSGDED